MHLRSNKVLPEYNSSALSPSWLEDLQAGPVHMLYGNVVRKNGLLKFLYESVNEDILNSVITKPVGHTLPPELVFYLQGYVLDEDEGRWNHFHNGMFIDKIGFFKGGKASKARLKAGTISHRIRHRLLELSKMYGLSFLTMEASLNDKIDDSSKSPGVVFITSFH